MEILNTPEVDELRRRIAKTSQKAQADELGLSEAMVSYVLTGKRTLRNEDALRKLGFTRICYTVPNANATKARKAIKELIS